MIASAAGIIAIINVLLISVFRRTKEIGTLRAIGASSGYIRAMLITENLILGAAGGAAGIMFSCVSLGLVNHLKIPLTNELLASLFGSSVLYFDFFPEIAAIAILVSLGVMLLSLIYPVETAVKIEPVIAVRDN